MESEQAGRTIHLSVEQADGGTRLDRFVPGREPSLSRSRVQQLLDEGRITVNGRVEKPSYRVNSGDRVVIEVPPPQPVELLPQAIPLNIVYEDENLLVIDKPAGMVVHPAHGHADGTLVNAILAHVPALSVNGEVRPGIVHRLDKDTSGLIVVAKNERAMNDVASQIREHTVAKRYLALVEGQVGPAAGTIDAPIGRDPRQRKMMAVVSGGRPARTHFRVLERFPQYTLVEATLETGRTHQIRVHFASIGHPIVGDPVYGRRKQRLDLERQFLHAYKLGFCLPGTGERVEFHSPLPKDLEDILEILRTGE